MNRDAELRFHERVDEKVQLLPWYVQEYISKKRRTLSAATLLNYCHDYLIFFDWLTSEGYFSGSRTEIPLETLNGLTVQEIEDFLSFLQFRLDNSPLTVNRKLSALKALFRYLQNIAETKELKPYLERNVMAKIELNQVKEDQEAIAQKMSGKILWDREYEQFRSFIAQGYGELYKDNKKRYNFHIQNRERDTAIISLILGSGLRLSEIVGLDVDDLDLKKFSARVTRKGNKEQYVFFSEQALLDLRDYLAVRKARYKLTDQVKALFISSPMGPKGTTRRMTPRAVEKMVEKYATEFGKPALSVHKLRHSFATRYHAENNDVPKLRRQLGHSSIQTTMIYTHLTNDELKRAVDKMDQHDENEG